MQTPKIGDKVKVTIHRNPPTVFGGEIIGETTTHWRIVHESNDSEGELFAKDSLKVSIVKQ